MSFQNKFLKYNIKNLKYSGGYTINMDNDKMNEYNYLDGAKIEELPKTKNINILGTSSESSYDGHHSDSHSHSYSYSYSDSNKSNLKKSSTYPPESSTYPPKSFMIPRPKKNNYSNSSSLHKLKNLSFGSTEEATSDTDNTGNVDDSNEIEFDEYKKNGKISSGSYGKVFKYTHTDVNGEKRSIAVKAGYNKDEPDPTRLIDDMIALCYLQCSDKTICDKKVYQLIKHKNEQELKTVIITAIEEQFSEINFNINGEWDDTLMTKIGDTLRPSANHIYEDISEIVEEKKLLKLHGRPNMDSFNKLKEKRNGELFECTKTSTDCINSYIKSIIVGDFIIMPLAKGNLTELTKLLNSKDSLNMDNVINCLYRILEHLICLHEKKLFYVDLKEQNILVINNPESNEIVDVVLGDIGSAVRSIKYGPATTYPPYDKKYRGMQTPTEEDVSWNFGIIVLNFLEYIIKSSTTNKSTINDRVEDMHFFSRSKLEKTSKKDFEKNVSKAQNIFISDKNGYKNNSHGNVIKNFIHKKPIEENKKLIKQNIKNEQRLHAKKSTNENEEKIKKNNIQIKKNEEKIEKNKKQIDTINEVFANLIGGIFTVSPSTRWTLQEIRIELNKIKHLHD
jgi:hypothetical protein